LVLGRIFDPGTTLESQMLHLSDNLYAGRINDAGDVRLLKFTNTPSIAPTPTSVYVSGETVLDSVIPAAVWPSVVANVSRRGEIENRFYVAQAFHNQVEPFATWAGQ